MLNQDSDLKVTKYNFILLEFSDNSFSIQFENKSSEMYFLQWHWLLSIRNLCIVGNAFLICRFHYVCTTSLHLLSSVLITDQVCSAFLSFFSRSKVFTEKSSNLFTVTQFKNLMEILIRVHLYHFKTCCGKDSSETTERKNFYLYSNFITFFLTYQHKQ